MLGSMESQPTSYQQLDAPLEFTSAAAAKVAALIAEEDETQSLNDHRIMNTKHCSVNFQKIVYYVTYVCLNLKISSLMNSWTI
jgi:hypothetical protein